MKTACCHVRRLDTLPGAALPAGVATDELASPALTAATSRAAAPAASAGELAAQETAAGVSARTWQTLREALAHAAEGRILTAAGLLGPAAAASSLSEAALLARLEQASPAAADAAQRADGSSAQPFHAVANAARGSASVASGNGPGSRQDSGPLSSKEAARILSLPKEAAWLREGLRQFHDREGYVMARDDDLKVSYRHLKGAHFSRLQTLPASRTSSSLLSICINRQAGIRRRLCMPMSSS